MADFAFRESMPKPWKDVPPLRESPFEPDKYDRERVVFAHELWKSLDNPLRSRDRQVEENLRMLAGQQWSVWSDLLGQWVDVTRYLTDEERRWRQLPVINRLLYWYMLLHARLTENPPVLTFLPGPDRIDAMAAEVADHVFKHLWHETAMLEVLDNLFAWLIPSGRAHLKSRIDRHMGEVREYRGPAVLRLLGADGKALPGPEGQPVERFADDVPYDAEGNPLARLNPDDTFDVLGDPFRQPEGAIVVDVLSCLEVRGEWGPTPWHRKRWHQHRSFLTPEELWEDYGVEVEPDVRGEEAESIGTLRRVLFGSGYYGAAERRDRGWGNEQNMKEGYVTVLETWFRPSDFPGMQRGPDSPGGRMLVTAGRNMVLRDGARYAAFPYTSPIRTFDFVNVAGRPQGTSPQEMLNGPARTRNRIYGQILQHATLVANPIQLIDNSTGIQEGQATNAPGANIFGNFRHLARPAIEYVSPPSLGSDVYRSLDLLTGEFDDLGNIPGAEGAPPTTDPSGELVKELRFNSDRFVAATARRSVVEIARVAEDWFAMLPVIWDRERVIRAGGDDLVAQTVMVMPELFTKGTLNVIPEVESMLPEGRGERQQRIRQMWQEGVWGPPQSPEARMMYLELARFPHLDRANRPGGVDRVTAEQENGRLVQGVPAAEVPVLEWYDHQVHLFVHERFMKGPEYLKLPVWIQQQFVQHREMHKMALAEAMARQLELMESENAAGGGEQSTEERPAGEAAA